MKSDSLILAIDQGTTSTRAVVFDKTGQPLTSAQQEFTQFFPQDGWVEHDADEIWTTVVNTCRKAITDAKKFGEIAAIGITNQRETTVIWDRRNGKVLHRAIVWQDRRTAAFCEQLKADGHLNMVQNKTGLLLDPYFSGTKIRWLLDNVPDARTLANEGHLACGTIDSYLIYRLTNGQHHRTDVTNASRTMLYDINKLCWDPDLMDLLDIPQSALPEVEDCDAFFGHASALFDHDVPICGVIGDQHAASVGQACFEKGMIKSTYGTGNFVMLNTGEEAVHSSQQLLTTICYRLQNTTHYALEGSVFIAGAVVQWLRDKLQVIDHAGDSEQIAENLNDDSEVIMVPAFTGLGAPYWNPDARGAVFGLTRNTGYEHIVTAALESVCFQSYDLLEAMQSDNAHVESLRVDGGMCANNWVMQRLADILNLPVERPENIETTVLGAAAVASLGCGLVKSIDELKSTWKSDRIFTPNMPDDLRSKKLTRWKHAIERVLD